MIDRVHFENFKSLANVTLDFGRFTALVGANGWVCRRGRASLLGRDDADRQCAGRTHRLAPRHHRELSRVARAARR